MHQFKDGVDPREYIRGTGRGGRSGLTYTRQDVAEVLGVSVRTLRRWASDSGTPFDVGSLEDICRAWHERAVHEVER